MDILLDMKFVLSFITEHVTLRNDSKVFQYLNVLEFLLVLMYQVQLAKKIVKIKKVNK